MTSNIHRLLAAVLILLGGCASGRNRPLASTTPSFPAAGALAAKAADRDAYAARSSGPATNTPPGARSTQPPPAVAALLDQAYQAELAARAAESRTAFAEARLGYQDARTAYSRVLELQPDHGYAHHRLATIADNEGRFTEAEEHYLAALRQSPHDSDLLSDLGYSYQLQGRYDLSERALNDALQHQPNHRGALYNLGALYAQRGNQELALSVFRRAGTEAEAQAALAHALRGNSAVNTAPALAAGGVTELPAPPNAGPATLPNTATSTGPSAAPANPFAVAQSGDKGPNRETQRIAAEMKRLRELQAQRNERAAPQLTAPTERPVPALPDRPDPRLLAQTGVPGQSGGAAGQAPYVPADQINQVFSHLDSRSDALTQANRPRRADDPAPNAWAGNPQQPLYPDPRLTTPAAPAAPHVSNTVSGNASTGPALQAPALTAPSPAVHSGNPPGPTGPWGGAQTASQVSQLSGFQTPAAAAPVIPAYGGVGQSTQDGFAASAPAPSGASPREAWDQANRQAALMGLNAGPGTALFPYSDMSAPRPVPNPAPAASSFNPPAITPGAVGNLGFESEPRLDPPRWNAGAAPPNGTGPTIRPIPTSSIQQISGYAPAAADASGAVNAGGFAGQQHFTGTTAPGASITPGGGNAAFAGSGGSASNQFNRAELAPAAQASGQWSTGQQSLSHAGTGQFASPQLNSAQYPPQYQFQQTPAQQSGQVDFGASRTVAGSPAGFAAPPPAPWTGRPEEQGTANFDPSRPATNMRNPLPPFAPQIQQTTGSGNFQGSYPAAAPTSTALPPFQSSWSTNPPR